MMHQVIESMSEVPIGEATELHNLLTVLSIEQLQEIRNYLIIQEWLKLVNQQKARLTL